LPKHHSKSAQDLVRNRHSILERGVQMKKLFLGSVALVASGLGAPAALAADMRVAPDAPPPPPAYTWSGCYIGASAGTSYGSSQHFTTAGSRVSPSPVPIVAGAPITDSFNLSGFIGGGQLGCNWQWGVWVFGIEGDGSATNKSGQAFETALNSVVPGSSSFISETQERWLVTARGRLGLSGWGWWGDKTLLYVTGGGAWAKIDVSEWDTLNPIARAHQESNTRSGWTVGGGIEYVLGYGWSVRSEYLYVDFGTFQSFTSGPFAPGIVFPRDVKLNDHIFRAGMNYKFW
jgi:outer membrane immunogenic protein